MHPEKALARETNPISEQSRDLLVDRFYPIAIRYRGRVHAGQIFYSSERPSVIYLLFTHKQIVLLVKARRGNFYGRSPTRTPLYRNDPPVWLTRTYTGHRIITDVYYEGNIFGRDVHTTYIDPWFRREPDYALISM